VGAELDILLAKMQVREGHCSLLYIYIYIYMYVCMYVYVYR